MPNENTVLKFGFNGRPVVEYLLFGAVSQVAETMRFRDTNGIVYQLPAGSLTDGASSRILWGHVNFLPTAAQNGPEAWLHDLHYKTGYVWRDGVKYRKITRLEADRVFRNGLAMRNIISFAYLGVRIGGFWTWRRYRREEKYAIHDKPDTVFIRKDP